MRTIILFLILFGLPSKTVWSQQKLATPLWIKMMRDSKSNYYKTIEAFKEFWEYRTLPKEPFESEELEEFEEEVGIDEEDEITDEQKKKFREKDLYKNVNFTAEVKEFKGWLRDVQPWIKEDGTIYTPEERQKVIDKQQKELKEIENKNAKQ